MRELRYWAVAILILVALWAGGLAFVIWIGSPAPDLAPDKSPAPAMALSSFHLHYCY